jgi:hypothetical protein
MATILCLLASALVLLSGCAGIASEPPSTQVPLEEASPARPRPSAEPSPPLGAVEATDVDPASALAWFVQGEPIATGPPSAICPDGSPTYAASGHASDPVQVPYRPLCGLSVEARAEHAFRFSGDATTSFQLHCDAAAAAVAVEFAVSLVVVDALIGYNNSRVTLSECAAGAVQEVRLNLTTQTWRVPKGAIIQVHIYGIMHERGTQAGLRLGFDGPLLTAAREAGERVWQHMQRGLDGELNHLRAVTTSSAVALNHTGWVQVAQDRLVSSGGWLNVSFLPRSTAVLALRVLWIAPDFSDGGFLVRGDVVAPGGSFEVPAFDLAPGSHLIVALQPMRVLGAAVAQPFHVDWWMAYEDSAAMSPMPTAVVIAEDPHLGWTVARA